jgi:hypothetical protein
MLQGSESLSWYDASKQYQLSLIHPQLKDRFRQPASPLLTRSDSSQQKNQHGSMNINGTRNSEVV